MSLEYDKRVLRLYSVMPGAPKPPEPDVVGYVDLWDVQQTEHWAFCASIVDMIEDLIEERQITP